MLQLWLKSQLNLVQNFSMTLVSSWKIHFHSAHKMTLKNSFQFAVTCEKQRDYVLVEFYHIYGLVIFPSHHGWSTFFETLIINQGCEADQIES